MATTTCLHRADVNANGLRTSYVHAGDGSKTVMLLHGGTPGADGFGYWEECLPLLAPTARVLAVDLPGFGQTEKPDPEELEYSQELRVAHLIAVIEALDLSNVFLVGTSLGGAAALGVCMERPDLVKGLVLVASAGLPNPHVSATAARVRGYDFTYEALSQLLNSFVDDRFMLPKRLVDYTYQLTLDEDHRRALQATSAWAFAHNMLSFPEEKIARVATPTLVVNGKTDRVTPLEMAYRFLELLENSWGWIIPKCGHLPMIECPDQLSRVIVNFAGTVSQASRA